MALHIRFLLVDTVADVETPSPFDVRMLAKAVESALTRRRALSAIARRPGWFGPLASRIEGWLVDHPRDAHALAIGLVAAQPDTAIHLLRSRWASNEERMLQCIEILAVQERLTSDADEFIAELLSRIVRDPRYVVPRIGAALARVCAERAAAFYLSCIEEEVRVVLADGANQREIGASEELLTLDVPVEQLIERVERAFTIAHEAPSDTYSPGRRGCEESLRHLLDQLLARLVKENADKLLERARTLAPGDALEKAYLSALTSLEGHVQARVAWAVAVPARLARDPESCWFVRALSAHLDASLTEELEIAIDGVELYNPNSVNDARHRFSSLLWNRGYRLYLRSLLVRTHRTRGRLSRDEAEVHQVPQFAPNRGIMGGLVQSPMRKAQLARASNDAVLRALERREERFRFTDDNLPVGDGEQVLSELGNLAEDDPERVRKIAWDLVTRGRHEEARDLIAAIARHHENAGAVQELALALFLDSGATLAEDSQCALALEQVARRAGLAPQTIARIIARLEAAKPIEQTEFKAEADEPERALFAIGFGGGVIPRGAFHWLTALVAHYAHHKCADPGTWSRAVRAALRADSRPETWRLMLDTHAENWWPLAGHGAGPLREVEAMVPATRSFASALVRVYTRARGVLETDAVEEFARRLVDQDALEQAAELVSLMVSDARETWPHEILTTWRSRDDAHRFAQGALACVGSLFDSAARRRALADIAVVWIPAAAPEDLRLLFDKSSDEGWFVDTDGLRVLEAASKRTHEMDPDALVSFVSVLATFVEASPGLVLAATEQALDRALALSESANQMVIGECLALSFALRLAVPEERARVHALFERALQSDALAAYEALNTADGGPSGPAWGSMGRALRMRPARRARRRGVHRRY